MREHITLLEWFVLLILLSPCACIFIAAWLIQLSKSNHPSTLREPSDHPYPLSESSADDCQVSILQDWLEAHSPAGVGTTTETPDPLPHTPQVVESSASLPSPLLTKNKNEETTIVSSKGAYLDRLLSIQRAEIARAKQWKEVGPKSPTVFTGTGEGCPDVEYLPVATPPPDINDYMTRIDPLDLERETYEAIRESCSDSSRKGAR